MIVEGYGTDFIKDKVGNILVMWDKNKRYRIRIRNDKDYNITSFSVRPLTKKEMDKFNKS